MFVLRLTCLLFGLSVGFAMSWHVAMDDRMRPLQFMGIGNANANEGEGGEGGGGFSAPTIRNISLETFMGLSKSRLIDMRELHARIDTNVVVEGFPASVVTDLLQAAIDDRSAIRRLWRALQGVTEDTKRQDIIFEHQNRATTSIGRLGTDVATTRGQITAEKAKSNSNPDVLSALREIEKKQLLRLEGAKRVRAFILTWLRNYNTWGR